MGENSDSSLKRYRQSTSNLEEVKTLIFHEGKKISEFLVGTPFYWTQLQRCVVEYADCLHNLLLTTPISPHAAHSFYTDIVRCLEHNLLKSENNFQQNIRKISRVDAPPDALQALASAINRMKQIDGKFHQKHGVIDISAKCLLHA